MHEIVVFERKKFDIWIVFSTKLMGLGINVQDIYDCWEWEIRFFCFGISFVFKKR